MLDMENKINVAELLKDCPKGMKLDCTMYDNVVFIEVDESKLYPITILANNIKIKLTKNGCYGNTDNAKCVIFPKGKTTWEGFHKPFKDGDILTTKLGNTFILKEPNANVSYYSCYIAIDSLSNIIKSYIQFCSKKDCRFATENEKQKLFDTIKTNGYKWNSKTKTLEELTKPIFKDGDILAIGDIVYIYNGKEDLSPFPTHHAYVIADKNGLFAINTSTKRYGTRFATEEEKNILFEAIKNNGYEWHQDTKTLVKFFKPFDKVLVRDYKNGIWRADFYSHYEDGSIYCYVCTSDAYRQCIPYNEETANLVSTTNDCSDKYKTWKDEE